MMNLNQFNDKELIIMIAIIMFALSLIIFFSYKTGYENGIINSYEIINQSFQNMTCISSSNNGGWLI